MRSSGLTPRKFAVLTKSATDQDTRPVSFWETVAERKAEAQTTVPQPQQAVPQPAMPSPAVPV